MEDKKNLGFLGVDFQFRLVKILMEDKELFRDLHSIIDQNTFTDPNLKTYVGVMKDYYDKKESFPTYEMMSILLNDKSRTDIDRETYKALNEKVRSTKGDGVDSIRELAVKFFRQQNIVRTANEILKLASNGSDDQYERCVDLLHDAISKGASYDLGSGVFEDLGDTLSEDYREPIPTGLKKLDESLNGGLGKGELGVIIGSSSFGKALSVNSLVVTPSGYRKMGDLVVNDYVIGSNGKKTKVVGVFPQGIRDLYKVTFSDGVSCVCDKEHLWTVGSIENRNEYEVLTLGKIMENGLLCNGEYRYNIPMTKAVEFTEKETIHFGDFIRAISTLYEEKVQVDKIPTEYLYNSLEKRILLLNTLMDDNGKCDKNGFVHFLSVTESLAEDIKQLVLSLGGFAKVVESNIKDKIFYEVIFNLCDETIRVFSDDEKQKQVSYTNKDNNYRYISNIEFSHVEEAVCIKVDAEDELFLTDDFIVTHNTSLTTAMASYAATFKDDRNLGQGYKVAQIVFEDGAKSIKRKHISRLTQIEACNLSKPENIEKVREMLADNPDYKLLRDNIRIITVPSGEKNATQIKELLKKLINSGFKPDMVVIDYFECVDLGDVGRGENEFNKEGKVMRKFENMCKELNVALWVTTQGTKDSVNAEIVTMDKAGGSFKKMQIAHVIISIARSMEDIKNNKATISLLKNRSGQAGSIWVGVTFNNGTCTMSTDNVEDFQEMFDYQKKKDKEEIDLTTSIFKEIVNNKNKPKYDD